jgi:uncharacterized protein YjbJ (UPF0337 family)
VRRRTERAAATRYIVFMERIATVAEWKAFRNEVRAHWQQLTDSQLDAIAGMRQRLAEQIRATYGVTPDEAERQIGHFEAQHRSLRAVSSR